MKIPKGKIIIFCVIFIGVLWGIYLMVFAPHYRYGQTSPNAQYTIEVYEQPKRLFTAPGDGGHRDARLILKNKWGFEIASSDKENSGIEFCENGIFEWDFDNNFKDGEQGFVWYVCGNARAGFNLKTKKFEY